MQIDVDGRPSRSTRQAAADAGEVERGAGSSIPRPSGRYGRYRPASALIIIMPAQPPRMAQGASPASVTERAWADRRRTVQLSSNFSGRRGRSPAPRDQRRGGSLRTPPRSVHGVDHGRRRPREAGGPAEDRNLDANAASADSRARRRGRQRARKRRRGQLTARRPMRPRASRHRHPAALVSTRCTSTRLDRGAAPARALAEEATGWRRDRRSPSRAPSGGGDCRASPRRQVSARSPGASAHGEPSFAGVARCGAARPRAWRELQEAHASKPQSPTTISPSSKTFGSRTPARLVLVGVVHAHESARLAGSAAADGGLGQTLRTPRSESGTPCWCRWRPADDDHVGLRS